MISNERPSPFRRPIRAPRPWNTAPESNKNRVDENTLHSETIRIERKTYTFLLKENPRGRFLRIVEEVGGRKSSIIVPDTGFADFQHLFGEILTAASELAPKSEA